MRAVPPTTSVFVILPSMDRLATAPRNDAATRTTFTLCATLLLVGVCVQATGRIFLVAATIAKWDTTAPNVWTCVPVVPVLVVIELLDDVRSEEELEQRLLPLNSFQQQLLLLLHHVKLGGMDPFANLDAPVLLVSLAIVNPVVATVEESDAAL